ncbi:SDR family NAD(P)-dependent oxidoreductase [Parapusillimonas granuli]|uniref:SDR family oxidoreductase n=1 Tax=Parapusillimonas granuli TaxID=380911 RepID=A0A853GAF1_9BURK|nr:SDR family oxidoreductase [Parapusillimonas granuli]MBB5216687.1 NAD(P)-dependent dehydrogenase (short-subunit alcohol dehydrogenase family) [Parapusillimonas granuli]NYT51746.1 SDR family oxidoreductase [Parapusillimonas granuli]
MEQHKGAGEGGLALVTGAAGGIGSEICRRLAARGLTVAVADLDPQRARTVAEGLGPAHVSLAFDVADEASVDASFERLESDHGPVRVVVCAAGLLQFGPGGERPLIQSTELDLWNRSMAVNATGVFLCARAYVRHRVAAPVAHGRFITFASVAAQLGGYRSSASYIAAKSAVLGFTKALAREVAPMGITVNSVSPGLIDTDMLRSTVASSGAMEAAAAAIPLGRIGTVADVASAVDYLVSEEAGYITGSVMDVNGGYRMQ